MLVERIQGNELSFGYSHPFKKLYLSKKLEINKGFYGGKITKKNFSFEHLKCHCFGGKTALDNLVVATKENNNARGNKPLKDFINFKYMEEYLAQFQDVVVDWFNGNKYIKSIRETVRNILKEESRT